MLYENDQFDVPPIELNLMNHSYTYCSFTTVTRRKLNIVLSKYKMILVEVIEESPVIDDVVIKEEDNTKGEHLILNNGMTLRKRHMKNQSIPKQKSPIIKKEDNTLLDDRMKLRMTTSRLITRKRLPPNQIQSEEEITEPKPILCKINQDEIDKRNIETIEKRSEQINKKKDKKKAKKNRKDEIIKEIICLVDDESEKYNDIVSLNSDDTTNLGKDIHKKTNDHDYNSIFIKSEYIDDYQRNDDDFKEDYDNTEDNPNKTPLGKYYEFFLKQATSINNSTTNINDNNTSRDHSQGEEESETNKDNKSISSDIKYSLNTITRENDISLIYSKKDTIGTLDNNQQQRKECDAVKRKKKEKERLSFENWTNDFIGKLSHLVNKSLKKKQDSIHSSTIKSNNKICEVNRKKKIIAQIFKQLHKHQKDDIWENILHLPKALNDQYVMNWKKHSNKDINSMFIVVMNYHDLNNQNKLNIKTKNEERPVEKKQEDKEEEKDKTVIKENIANDKPANDNVPIDLNPSSKDILFGSELSSSLSDSSSSISSTEIEKANDIYNKTLDTQEKPINNRTNQS